MVGVADGVCVTITIVGVALFSVGLGDGLDVRVAAAARSGAVEDVGTRGRSTSLLFENDSSPPPIMVIVTPKNKLIPTARNTTIIVNCL